MLCWRHYHNHTPSAALLLRRRRRRINFIQTSSAYGDPLDLSDHPLLLDIFSLGPPQLRTGLGFLFSFKMSFEKHPNVDSDELRQWTTYWMESIMGGPLNQRQGQVGLFFSYQEQVNLRKGQKIKRRSKILNCSCQKGTGAFET